MFSIKSNLPAVYTADVLGNISEQINRSIRKLATGKRIVTASDDPGSVHYLSRLKALNIGWKTASRNLEQASDLLNTAQYALSGLNGIKVAVFRMRELVLEAANTSTLTSEDLEAIQQEIEQMVEEVDRIGRITEYNTKKLLDGSMAGAITSSSPYVEGFVLGRVEESVFEFSSARAATRAVVNASLPIPEDQRMPTSLGDAYDYTRTLGEAVFSPDTTQAAAYDADYDIIFTPGNPDHDFEVYDASTGTSVGTGTFGTAFVVASNNNVKITIYSGSQTIQEGYKGIWHVDTDPSKNVAQEGNMAVSGSITIGRLSDRSLLNGTLFIQFDWVNGRLSYRVVDADGVPQGSWVSVGATFHAYQDSKLQGSYFTLNIATIRDGYQSMAGKGDTWKITFREYDGLAGEGSFTVEIGGEVSSVYWSGEDTVEDLRNRLNNALSPYAHAFYATSSGTEYISIRSSYPGSLYVPQLRDVEGNLVSVVGFSLVSGTGTDALITVEGRTYGPQSSNLFYGIVENGVIVLKEGAVAESGIITVKDYSQKVAAGPGSGQDIVFYIPPVNSLVLGFRDPEGNMLVDVTRPKGAERALNIVDNAIETLSRYEALIGSFMNRLDRARGLAEDEAFAITQAVSSIEDADVAEELVKLTTLEMQQNTAAMMLAHANLQPERIWKLLFGLAQKE